MVCMPSRCCSSISPHCAVFCGLLIQFLICCSLPLCFSDPSGSNLFFLSSLLLSHGTRISAMAQFRRCFLTGFAKDLTGCFSHCCVEGSDHGIHACIFIIHVGERCKLLAHHSLEGFQNIGIFRLFEVKLESCVFLACWFFSDGGRRSSSTSRGNVLENGFWLVYKLLKNIT